MDYVNKRRALINQKRQDLKKRYGVNPIIYSSGEGIDSEKQYPEKMRINLKSKILEECLIKK